MRVNDRYVSFYYQNDHDMGEIQIDKSKTALLVIDMQNGFVKQQDPTTLSEEDRKEQERWAAFYEAIEGYVIPNNAKILDACRKAGIEVVFAQILAKTKDGRERSLDHRSSGFNDLLFLPGSWDGAIVDELQPLEDELIVTKTTDSALTGTALRLWLHNMDIDTVIVTGVFTDQCVSCTVRSLADESFKVWLLEDATRAATQQIQDNELEILNNIYCHVINTEELLAALSD